MGVALAILGGIIATVTFISGVMTSPNSAPQQAVQELRFVEAILGLVVMSLGCAVYRLSNPVQIKPEDGRLSRLRMAGCRVDGLDFEPNGAVMFRETNTAGPWTPDQKAQVHSELARPSQGEK